jgi:hypothetical protein
MKTDITRRKFIVKAVAAALGLISLAAHAVTTKKTAKKPQLAAQKSKSTTKAKTLAADALSSETQSSNVSGARLGINLAGIADWNSELPFVDMFRMSREWISQSNDGGWATGPALDIDENGWVKRIANNCHVTTFLSSDEHGRFYAGDYVVLYEGEGELVVPFHKVKSSEKGRLVVKVDPKKGTLGVDILKTNPQNYIKNIKVIMPEFEKSYQDNPWHPDFLKRWTGVACIRLMDFMATNNSMQATWANRPKKEDASFAVKGVPVELMVDLANRLNCDPWFCMPHLANDDYVKQFASYVKTNLNAHLNPWIEYSNELWNTAFQQTAYAGTQGQRLKFAENGWEGGWRYTAYRSVEIFKIWNNIFASSRKVIRVLGSQAASIGVTEQILSFQNAAKQADVLAIAPYISFNVSPTLENGISDKVVSNWNLDKLFEHLNQKSLPECEGWIKSSKKAADKNKLKLVAYEDGQHLVGVLGAENNEKLEKLLLKANTDERMGDLYTKHLKAWTDNGGDLVCSFNSVSTWSKWGSWGLVEYYDDKPTPKYKAVIDWAKSRGQKLDY